MGADGNGYGRGGREKNGFAEHRYPLDAREKTHSIPGDHCARYGCPFAFVTRGDDKSGRIEQTIMIMDDVRGRDNPLAGVPVDELIAWAKRGAPKRFVTLAQIVDSFEGDEDSEDPGAWTAVAKMIVTDAPEQEAVLKIILRRLIPGGWTGSRAPILEKRRKLVAEFSGSLGGGVKAWEIKADAMLSKAAADDRERERRHDQSFE